MPSTTTLIVSLEILMILVPINIDDTNNIVDETTR